MEARVKGQMDKDATTLKGEMADLAGKIQLSLAHDPDNFDARESLWRRREDLRSVLLAKVIA